MPLSSFSTASRCLQLSLRRSKLLHSTAQHTVYMQHEYNIAVSKPAQASTNCRSMQQLQHVDCHQAFAGMSPRGLGLSTIMVPHKQAQSDVCARTGSLTPTAMHAHSMITIMAIHQQPLLSMAHDIMDFELAASRLVTLLAGAWHS